MTYSESSTLRYAGLSWRVRSITSAVATSAGFMARVDTTDCPRPCSVARACSAVAILVDVTRRRHDGRSLSVIVSLVVALPGVAARRDDPRDRRRGEQQDHRRHRHPASPASRSATTGTTTIQEQVRLDLVSSGLFKDVEVFCEPHPKGGRQGHILAKDKHSWVIAPTFYNQPTNNGGGVGFGENNLFGENQKLLLYGQIATGDSFFIGA